MGANPWALGASLAGSLIGAIGSGIQKGRGRRMLAKMKDPIMSVPTAIEQNKQMADLQANVGMPSQEYSQAMKNIQRNQLASLRQSNDRRGGLGMIAALNDSSNNAMGNLDAKSAQMRVSNQRNQQNVNNTLGNWQNKVWDNNVRQKFMRDRSYAMSMIGAGNQNQMAALDKGLGAVAMFGGQGGFGGQGYDETQALAGGKIGK